MSKPLKQFLLFLGLVALVQLLSSPFQNFGDYIYLTIKDELAPMGLEFNAKEAKFSLPMKLLVPFSEIKWKTAYGTSNFVSLNNLEVSLSLLKLLKLQRSIQVLLNAHEGNARIALEQGLFDQSNLDFSANLEQINLAQLFPEYKDRIEAKLDASFKSRLPILKGTIDLSGHSKFDGALKIREGLYKGGDKIMGLIILPAASDIKFDVDITGEDTKYEFKDLSFSSSLGTVSGQASIELSSDLRFPKSLDINLKIDLTEKGSSFFSEYLKLSSKTQSQLGHRKWSLTINKRAQDLIPKVESTPL